MTRMITTPHARLYETPRTTGGRLATIGRTAKRVVGTASATAEMFPPVVLLGGLALYFYIIACMGNGADGTTP